MQPPTGTNNSNNKASHPISIEEMKNVQYVRLLGQGGCGKVYEARLPSSPNKKIAVKEVNIYNRNSLLLAETEIAIWNKLSSPPHPNIVSFQDRDFIYDGNGKPKLCRMFMDLAEFGSLQHYLWSKYPQLLTENVIRPIMTNILTGLHYIHSLGIIHRDLKAVNILLFRDIHDEGATVATIADFGLSEYIGINGVTRGRVGPWPWIAPEVQRLSEEQVKDEDHNLDYTFSADIWSVGYILLEMLTGGQNPRIKTTDGHWEWNVPSGITLGCQNFLSQCLREEPAHRATAQQLLEHPWLRTSPQHPLNPSPPQSTPHNCSAAPPVVDEQLVELFWLLRPGEATPPESDEESF